MALAALTTGKRTPGQAIADPGYFNLRRPPLHGRQGRRPWRVSTCTSPSSCRATPTTTSSPTTWGSTRSPTSCAQLGSASAPGIDLPARRRASCPRPNGSAPLQAPEQQKWFGGETISVGIGQGYNAYTPLQLAQALGRWWNNGVLYRPHLARDVVDAKTGEKRTIEPSPRTIPQAVPHRPHQARDGRREQGRHGQPARLPGRPTRSAARPARRRSLAEGRQQVRGRPGGRAPARPRVVHRLRAGRQAGHRAGGAGRERRLRCPVRRARSPARRSTTTCSASCRRASRPKIRRPRSRRNEPAPRPRRWLHYLAPSTAR